MDKKRVSNQALFRSVNERIRPLNEAFSEQLDLDTNVLCECPDLGCTESVPVPVADYRRIREEPTWFLVVPDHLDPELEKIVERQGLYLVVSVPADLLPDRGEGIRQES